MHLGYTDAWAGWQYKYGALVTQIDLKQQMSRQGGKRRVAQVQADQQHIGQDLEVGTWEDCIEINSYIVNTNTSLTKSGLSNKRTM